MITVSIRNILFFLLSLLPLSCFAGPLEGTIVVWRLEPKSGVTDKDADAISGIVIAEVGRISGKKIIGETDMRSLMAGEQKKLSCGAEDSACVAEIGAALGAPESITGTIAKMGDYWLFTLQRLNVRTVDVVARSSRKINGDLNMLVESISPAVAELFPEINPPKTTEIQPVENKAKPPLKQPDRTLIITGWSLAGSGAAIIIFGGVSQALMVKSKSKWENAGGSSDKDSYESWRALSITGYTIGSLALAAGASLLIYDAVKPETKNPGIPKAAVLPSPDGFLVSLEWRW